MSSVHRELKTQEEIQRVASETVTAWQHPAIPMRQYELVRHELEMYRIHKNGEPFAGFSRCMEQLSTSVNERGSRLLDVGASGGYYGELLRMIGWRGQYTACDSSRAFAELAQGIYPGIDYDIGDACGLPYRDDWFDIVLSSGCIMHIYEWQKAIAELARTSSRYVILHRTPVSSETRYFEKIAYGVRCLEVHFSPTDLSREFVKAGMWPVYETELTWDAGMQYKMRSYVLEKPNLLRHLQV